MKSRKPLALAGAGVAALALGAGLFAWQAAVVTTTDQTVGVGDIAAACTANDLVVTQNVPVWNGTGWTLDGVTVSTAENVGNAACAGLDLTVTGVDGTGTATTLTGTEAAITLNNGAIDTAVTWAPADPTNVVKWLVSIG